MPKPLTTTEAAALTRPPTTRFTVEREIRRGKLEAEKVGGRWMIQENDARAWAKTFRPYEALRHPRT